MYWKRRHEPSDDCSSVTNGSYIIWIDISDVARFTYSSCDDEGEPDYVDHDEVYASLKMASKVYKSLQKTLV